MWLGLILKLTIWWLHVLLRC